MPPKAKPAEKLAPAEVAQKPKKIIKTLNTRFPDDGLNLTFDSPDYALIDKFQKKDGVNNDADYKAYLATLEKQKDIKLCGIRLNNVYSLSHFDDLEIRPLLRKAQENKTLLGKSIGAVKKGNLLDINIPDNILGLIKDLAEKQKTLDKTTEEASAEMRGKDDKVEIRKKWISKRTEREATVGESKKKFEESISNGSFTKQEQEALKKLSVQDIEALHYVKNLVAEDNEEHDIKAFTKAEGTKNHDLLKKLFYTTENKLRNKEELDFREKSEELKKSILSARSTEKLTEILQKSSSEKEQTKLNELLNQAVSAHGDETKTLSFGFFQNLILAEFDTVLSQVNQIKYDLERVKLPDNKVDLKDGDSEATSQEKLFFPATKTSDSLQERQSTFANLRLSYTNGAREAIAHPIKIRKKQLAAINDSALNIALQRPAVRPFKSKMNPPVVLSEDVTLSYEQLVALEAIETMILKSEKWKEGEGKLAGMTTVRIKTGGGKSTLAGIIEKHYPKLKITNITLNSSMEELEKVLNGDKKGQVSFDEAFFYGDRFKEKFCGISADNKLNGAQITLAEVEKIVEKERVATIRRIRAKGTAVIIWGASESLTKIDAETVRMRIKIQDEKGALDAKQLELQKTNAAFNSMAQIAKINEEFTQRFTGKGTNRTAFWTSNDAERQYLEDTVIKLAGIDIMDKNLVKTKAISEEKKKTIIKNIKTTKDAEGTETSKAFSALQEEFKRLDGDKKTLQQKKDALETEIETIKSGPLQEREIRLEARKRECADLEKRRNHDTTKQLTAATLKIAKVAEDNLAKQTAAHFGDKLVAGQRMQYLLPNFDIDVATNCTEQNLIDIRNVSGADIIIIPVIKKNGDKNELQYRILHREGTAAIFNFTEELGEKLFNEKLNALLKDNPNYSILSFFDKKTTIGGDYGKASVLGQNARQVVQIDEKTLESMTFNEGMQWFNRDRTARTDDGMTADIKRTFVINSDKTAEKLGETFSQNTKLEKTEQLISHISQQTEKYDEVHKWGYLSAKIEDENKAATKDRDTKIRDEWEETIRNLEGREGKRTALDVLPEEVEDALTQEQIDLQKKLELIGLIQQLIETNPLENLTTGLEKDEDIIQRIKAINKQIDDANQKLQEEKDRAKEILIDQDNKELGAVQQCFNSLNQAVGKIHEVNGHKVILEAEIRLAGEYLDVGPVADGLTPELQDDGNIPEDDSKETSETALMHIAEQLRSLEKYKKNLSSLKEKFEQSLLDKDLLGTNYVFKNPSVMFDVGKSYTFTDAEKLIEKEIEDLTRNLEKARAAINEKEEEEDYAQITEIVATHIPVVIESLENQFNQKAGELSETAKTKNDQQEVLKLAQQKLLEQQTKLKELERAKREAEENLRKQEEASRKKAEAEALGLKEEKAKQEQIRKQKEEADRRKAEEDARKKAEEDAKQKSLSDAFNDALNKAVGLANFDNKITARHAQFMQKESQYDGVIDKNATITNDQEAQDAIDANNLRLAQKNRLFADFGEAMQLITSYHEKNDKKIDEASLETLWDFNGNDQLSLQQKSAFLSVMMNLQYDDEFYKGKNLSSQEEKLNFRKNFKLNETNITDPNKTEIKEVVIQATKTLIGLDKTAIVEWMKSYAAEADKALKATSTTAPSPSSKARPFSAGSKDRVDRLLTELSKETHH